MLPSDIFILALNHSCLGRQPENLPLTAQRVLRCNFVKVRVFLFFWFFYFVVKPSRKWVNLTVQPSQNQKYIVQENKDPLGSFLFCITFLGWAHLKQQIMQFVSLASPSEFLFCFHSQYFDKATCFPFWLTNHFPACPLKLLLWQCHMFSCPSLKLQRQKTKA